MSEERIVIIVKGFKRKLNNEIYVDMKWDQRADKLNLIGNIKCN